MIETLAFSCRDFATKALRFSGDFAGEKSRPVPGRLELDAPIRCMQVQVVAPSRASEAIDIAWAAPDMHCPNASRLRGDGLFDPCGVEGAGARGGVAEDRVQADPTQGMRSGDEGERWHDDLTGEVQCACR